jgi:hypothetical protein
VVSSAILFVLAMIMVDLFFGPACGPPWSCM